MQLGSANMMLIPQLVFSWWLCCFMSTETVGLLRTGTQDGHLDFHTAPELCRFSRLRYLFVEALILLGVHNYVCVCIDNSKSMSRCM